MQTYLNNAGAGLMDDRTYQSVVSYMQLERELGAYRVAAEQKPLLDKFYTHAARLIHADHASEIAFIDSASRGWDMVVYGSRLQKGDKIITLSSEFGTNLVSLFDYARQVGAIVKVIACDQRGDFSMEAIEKELKAGAKLVAISHVASQGSIVNPVEQIGRLARSYGATYIVDGCQAVGHLPVDVCKIQCDAYMTTGRKWLCAPRGTGFLYVKTSAPLRTPQVDMSSAELLFDDQWNVVGVDVRKDARQFELWERNYANVLGATAALERCLEKGEDRIFEQIQPLSNALRSSVLNNPNFQLIGQPNSPSGIVGFYLKDPVREEALADMFAKNNIGISMMGRSSCPLHFPKNGATTIFRLSPHYYSDVSSIQIVCRMIAQF